MLKFTESHQELINMLEKEGYTDGVDIATEESLFEYGFIRNPKTNRVILCFNPCGEPIIGYDWTDIEESDVKEALEDAEQGFFEYIGSSRAIELSNLDNNNLGGLIYSLMSYSNPWAGLDYPYAIKSIKECV